MPQLALATSTASGKAAAARFRIASDDLGGADTAVRAACHRTRRELALERGQVGGRHPHHRAAVRVEAQRADDRQARGLGPGDRRLGLVARGHRLDPEHVGTTAREARRLFGERVARRLEAQRADGRHDLAGGPHAAGDDDLAPALVGDPAGNPRRRLVQFRDARFRLVQGEPVTVATEAVGENDVGARVDETAMQRGRSGRGCGDVPQLRRVARNEPLGEQVAARGAVGKEPRSGGQQSGEAIGHRGRAKDGQRGNEHWTRLDYPRCLRKIVADPCLLVVTQRRARRETAGFSADARPESCDRACASAARG